MDKVAVVIPNYNGYRYLETCFAALAKQTFTEFTTYFVDNGSQDESCAFLREHYPETKIIQLDDNYGFSRAVNEGIRRSKEPYVILLNNDTEVFPDFVERLYEGICKRKNAFACSAKLISYQERDKIDDAGNYYNERFPLRSNLLDDAQQTEQEGTDQTAHNLLLVLGAL